MILYKEPAIKSLSAALIDIRNHTVHKNWTKGSVLVASCSHGPAGT